MQRITPGPLLCLGSIASAQPIKTEAFDSDPDREGRNNRIVPKKPPMVTQNHGFNATSIAGGAAGEIGGTVWRTGKNFAHDAVRFGPLTMDDRPEACGKVTPSVGGPGSAACIGWFSSETNKEGARPDRFGIRSACNGGSLVKICFDDPTCTAGRQ